MTKKNSSTKSVQVVAVYRFKKVARICFTVLSSDGATKYNCCFSNDAEHGSCTCPAGEKGRKCYHREQLRQRASEYFTSCQPSQPVAPVIETTPEVEAQAAEAEAEDIVVRARREVARAEAGIRIYNGEALQALMAQEKARSDAFERERAALNGSRAFQLMR